MVQAATMVKKTSPANTRLAVGRLDLTHFRNYRSVRLDLPTGKQNIVVLSGQNGAGKTNLLEAISFLGPGRGLRGAKLSDVTQAGQDQPWAVSGIVTGTGEDVKIGAGIEFTANSVRRLVIVDGERTSGPAALAAHISILWLTPRMDRLFMEGPSDRRRFFDRLVAGFYPEHATQVSGYERAMRERFRLLSDAGSVPDDAWMGALEKRMAEHAIAIAATRLETLGLLQAHLAFSRKTSFPLPDLGLQGTTEDMVASLPALEAEDQFASDMRHNRSIDTARGRTHKGPHKTDLMARHPGKDMAAEKCSTGEQKGMLVGILLAAARLQQTLKGKPPVLLLDELAAHLDETRRHALFEEIESIGAQTWVTGTDEKLFQPLKKKAAFFHVADGKIT